VTVTRVDTDYENLTITLVADFEAPVERVWRLFADPRQLEAWWGPPGYPATVERHELADGGVVGYFMTSPDGARYHGRWEVVSVQPPQALEFVDSFADADGEAVTDMPSTTTRVRLTAHGARTRMELQSTCATREQLEQLVELGAVEGLRLAIGQIDALLDGTEGEER
jgi:uncharacterized protein YndB with AHSA1/START domain